MSLFFFLVDDDHHLRCFFSIITSSLIFFDSELGKGLGVIYEFRREREESSSWSYEKRVFFCQLSYFSPSLDVKCLGEKRSRTIMMLRKEGKYTHNYRLCVGLCVFQFCCRFFVVFRCREKWRCLYFSYISLFWSKQWLLPTYVWCSKINIANLVFLSPYCVAGATSAGVWRKTLSASVSLCRSIFVFKHNWEQLSSLSICPTNALLVLCGLRFLFHVFSLLIHLHLMSV